MKKTYLLFLLIGIMFIFGCDKDPQSETAITKESLTGFAQKGPFNNGTAITIAELNTSMEPTGRNFSAEILDNTGAFELKNIELASQYVEIRADGFYFNEVVGEISQTSLKLSAIADLLDINTVNVNLLSHLERSRAIYLISNKQYSFDNAKAQALKEILSVFCIEKNDVGATENMNIAESGDNNAILLAVSVILQGERTTAELSELLANTNTDLREDGVLNSVDIKNALVGQLKDMNLSKIRQNLEQRYQSFGMNIEIPDFEKYVNYFIENNDFDSPDIEMFPETGKYGINILHYNYTESFFDGEFCSFAAQIPTSATLKVVITGEDNVMTWGYNAAHSENWKISEYEPFTNSQTIEVIKAGQKSDAELLLFPGTYKIDYYINGDATPTYTKKITIKSFLANLPQTGLYGENILFLDADHFSANTDYSFAANIPQNAGLTINLTSSSATVTWSYSDATNWEIYDENSNNYSFRVITGGQNSDMRIRFQPGTYTVHYDLGMLYQYIKTILVE